MRLPVLGGGALLALGLALGNPAVAAAADPGAPNGGLPPAALYRDLGLSAAARPFPAPGFTLPDLAGKPVRLADFPGRAVLLYFWTTW
jgi:hypothetical protein